MPTQIGCFISPHGYGHATRSIAVLEALHDRVPDLHSHLFTTVTERLFQNVSFPFTYHRLQSDIGLIHTGNLAIDMDRTIEELSRTLPYKDSLLDEYARICRHFQLLYCDISTLGIEIAKHASIPSLLVENFTWDWIYTDLAATTPSMSRYVDLLSRSYGKADYRIQAEPVCNHLECNLTTPPIARKKRGTTAELAHYFDSSSRPLVLISMGGIPLELPFLHELERHQDYYFLIAGRRDSSSPGENIRLISTDADFYHPDLIDSVDLVICKTGYSTIAECAQTSTPICCVRRADFAESPVLEAYVYTELNGTLLDFSEFLNGSWLARLPAYLRKARKPIQQTGAAEAAAFIHRLLAK